MTGKVLDESGTPLPGVNVLLKGSTRGTTTDSEGLFNLAVGDDNDVLVFSFIGYKPVEESVGKRTVIQVKLTADLTQLGEVVVVGYGTQSKASVSGAIGSVSSKEISAQPVINVSQALQGRVAGVSVTNNGAPGAAPIIRIRGIGTINNADPLYVVDGFPTGDLNSFDTRDIESVEVLKDASAAAIYGSRAANGVILITTKKGSSNEFRVNFDSYIGVENAWKKLDLLKREDYLDYAVELETNAAIAAGKDPLTRIPQRIQSGMDSPINSTSSTTFNEIDTDWQEEMFQQSTIQQHRVELTGGNANSRFYSSLGYFSQEGIMIGTGYERGNFRFNSKHNLSKRFSLGENVYVSYDDQDAEQVSGGRTNIQHMVKSIPYLPVYNPDNLGGFEGAKNLDGSDPENPVRIATMDQSNTQRFKMIGTAYLDASIVEGLDYRLQVGIDYVNSTSRSHLPAFNTGPGGFAARTTAQIGQTRASYSSPIVTNQLTFDKEFGRHKINVTAIAENQTAVYSNITGGGQNSESNDIKEPSALETPTFSGGKTKTALISYLGRINYGFNGKYFVTASFRRDGSSRFAPGNKWGSFPAASAAWLISEEPFMKSAEAISTLKIRGSYGKAGNNNIGDYAYQAVLSGNQVYEFDAATAVRTSGYTVRALANRNLKWETTVMKNIGLDLGFLNNKVTLVAEYFDNTTEDMILSKPIPPSLGYDQPPVANTGSVNNKGLEFMLAYEKNEGAFQWRASANASFIRNEVLSLAQEGSKIPGANWAGDDLTLTEVGQPIGYFYGYQVDGIFQSAEEIAAADAVDGDAATKYQSKAAPGDIRFKDNNGDGVIDAKDKAKLGHFLPDMSFGVNLSMNYKNFDVNIFLQGVHGNDVYNVLRYDLEGMTRLFNSSEAVKNRWTTPGQETDIPRAISGDPNLNARASDRFMEDGSYLRVKNLSIGYTLPNSVMSTFLNGSIKRLRIYFNSQNLLTFTDYSGYDPEIGSRFNSSLTTGIDYGQYPQARTLIVGLQVGL